jgi:Aldo/keto reductase family
MQVHLPALDHRTMDPARTGKLVVRPRAGMMSTSALGRMQVRRSGYGAMQLAGPYAFGTPPDRASAIDMLRAAAAAGVDHIDTAQYYGSGVVNGLIREALYPYPDGLAIVSKVAVRRDDRGAVSRSTIRTSCAKASKTTCAACGCASWQRSASAYPATGASTRALMTSWPRWPAQRA